MADDSHWSPTSAAYVRQYWHVGYSRAHYLGAPERRALWFALELNSYAIDQILYERAGRLLDEAAEVLDSHMREFGASMDCVTALVGVLTNRADLRDLDGVDPADTLVCAGEASDAAVEFTREAIEAYRVSRADADAGERRPDTVESELTGLLVDALTSKARVLSDMGELSAGQAVLEQARELLDQLVRLWDGREDEQVQGSLARRGDLIADTQGMLEGRPRDVARNLWYRPSRSALW